MNRKNSEQSDHEHDTFAKRARTAVGISVSVILLLLLAWLAMDVLLLAFAGILLAIFLRSISDALSAHTRLANGWALAVAIVGLGLVIGLSVWRLVPEVADQVDQLSDTLPQSVQRVEQYLEQHSWGRQLLKQMPIGEKAGGNASQQEKVAQDRTNALNTMAGRAARFFSTTLGALMNIFILLILGIYLAAEPELYTRGVVRLVALDKRPRAHEVLQKIGETLRWWLVGQIFSMLVIGVLTTLGLTLLGVPLALALGVLAGLLAFIPNIGPILAVIPATLLAFLHSPSKALYVFLLYFGIQIVETYLLTPFVQRRTILLPPALTITGQILFGVLFGSLGLLLATPLIATTVVAVDMLYIEDTLGDRSGKSPSNGKSPDRAPTRKKIFPPPKQAAAE